MIKFDPAPFSQPRVEKISTPHLVSQPPPKEKFRPPTSFWTIRTLSKRTFLDSTKEAFVNSLLNTDWTFVEDQISTQNINIVYTSFITKYKSLYDLAFPLVKVTQKRRDGPRQPWMTMALLKSCKKKAKLYKKFLKNPTPQNKLKFTQYRNKFKQI